MNDSMWALKKEKSMRMMNGCMIIDSLRGWWSHWWAENSGSSDSEERG